VDPLAAVGARSGDTDLAATRGVDRRNNVEQVLVAAPVLGQWTVRVRGVNVPEGPQPVSIWAIAGEFASTSRCAPRTRTSGPSATPWKPAIS
jgi:hypothetical protein